MLVYLEAFNFFFYYFQKTSDIQQLIVDVMGQRRVVEVGCNDNLIMQYRLSNGSPGPFHGSNPQPHTRKHKQQAIFTYNNKDHPSRNVYYDANPYYLHSLPADPQFKNIIATSRNSSRSRDCSQTQSQRSCKVIRANGLGLVQKPTLKKVQSNQHINGPRLNDQTIRSMQRQYQLEAQNKALRGQNQYLKDKIRTIEQNKRYQVSKLEEKIQYLHKLTQNLEKKMESAENQWKQQVRRLQEGSLSDI